MKEGAHNERASHKKYTDQTTFFVCVAPMVPYLPDFLLWLPPEVSHDPLGDIWLTLRNPGIH